MDNIAIINHMVGSISGTIINQAGHCLLPSNSIKYKHGKRRLRFRVMFMPFEGYIVSHKRTIANSVEETRENQDSMDESESSSGTHSWNKGSNCTTSMVVSQLGINEQRRATSSIYHDYSSRCSL